MSGDRATSNGWMELGAHEALTMGSDLWIIADLAHSAWARKIDWYLNFQLSRAAHHTRQEISPELAATAESWEFDPPVIDSQASQPLLVASGKFLPNQMTLQVTGSGASWVETAVAAISSLQPRSTRIFLPSTLDLGEFSSHWRSAGGALSESSSSRFTVVLDQGARSN